MIVGIHLSRCARIHEARSGSSLNSNFLLRETRIEAEVQTTPEHGKADLSKPHEFVETGLRRRDRLRINESSSAVAMMSGSPRP